jgi:hypothetical protein
MSDVSTKLQHINFYRYTVHLDNVKIIFFYQQMQILLNT